MLGWLWGLLVPDDAVRAIGKVHSYRVDPIELPHPFLADAFTESTIPLRSEIRIRSYIDGGSRPWRMAPWA